MTIELNYALFLSWMATVVLLLGVILALVWRIYRRGMRVRRTLDIVQGDLLHRYASNFGVAPVEGESDAELRRRVAHKIGILR